MSDTPAARIAFEEGDGMIKESFMEGDGMIKEYSDIMRSILCVEYLVDCCSSQRIEDFYRILQHNSAYIIIKCKLETR